MNCFVVHFDLDGGCKHLSHDRTTAVPIMAIKHTLSCNIA